MIFIRNISKLHNSAKTVDGVTFHVFGIWSGGGLYLYLVSRKNLGLYQSFEANTYHRVMMDGRTHGWIRLHRHIFKSLIVQFKLWMINQIFS